MSESRENNNLISGPISASISSSIDEVDSTPAAEKLQRIIEEKSNTYSDCKSLLDVALKIISMSDYEYRKKAAYSELLDAFMSSEKREQMIVTGDYLRWLAYDYMLDNSEWSKSKGKTASLVNPAVVDSIQDVNNIIKNVLSLYRNLNISEDLLKPIQDANSQLVYSLRELNKKCNIV